MKNYAVKVVKLLRVEGTVEIKAESEEAALKTVQERMSDTKNPMQTTEPDWDDPEYIDFSFETTGDVSEA
jgi:hypothetical protein